MLNDIQKYDIAFRDEYYRSEGAAEGPKYIEELCKTISFKSVLDVGCGPGWAIKEFIRRKYQTLGIEYCQYLFEHILADLPVVHGSITDIPFPEDTFDLVFCTDVMEHIPEDAIQQAISEMVCVTRQYLYLTISSTKAKCFPELNLHCTIKPRSWWTLQFSKFRLEEIAYGSNNEYLYQLEK